MSAAAVLAVLAAGAGGAVLRAVVVGVLPRTGTAVVNVVGTAVLAVVVALAGTGRLGPTAAAVWGLGLAGSLTTFSGWVVRVADGWRTAPGRTLVLEVAAPVLTGVAITVLALVALS